MINHLTKKAEMALNFAVEAACEFGHTYIGSEHLLLGLCSVEDSIAMQLLNENGLSVDTVREQIVFTTGCGAKTAVTSTDMTPRLRKIIECSAVEAIKYGSNRVGTEHLLLAMLKESNGIAIHLLEENGILIQDISNELRKFLTLSAKAHRYSKENLPAPIREEKNTAKETPLQQYTKDMTALASVGKIDPTIGRDSEIERMIRILSRRSKNNPCLVGDPGVGKTAVVEGMALRIVNGQIPAHLKGKRLLSLDISSMLAGAKYRGEFEDRFKQLLREVEQSTDIILFIDEIHTLVGAGAAEGALDAANIIKPALSRGELQLIGATTPAEYRKYIEKDAALERRFQPVRLLPPSEEDCLLILKGIREKYEMFHEVIISDEALHAAIELSIRYLPERFLPDKAIDLLDEACAALKIEVQEEPLALALCKNGLIELNEKKEHAILQQNFELAAKIRDDIQQAQVRLNELEQQDQREKKEKRPYLTMEHIANIVSAWTGIPVSMASEKQETDRLLRLEEILQQHIIGQEEAISTICAAIRRNRTGIRDPRRPIGSFLLAGPSGVGKTELCRVLARELYQTEDALIRLDMSEYMERHSVSRMIGSPPGYIGYEEGGQLSERVRYRPYSIVLLDEIEKAHADIYHLLLQILEDGTLTDSGGRRIDFKNTIIVMTSNVGARERGQSLPTGFSSDTNQQAQWRYAAQYREEQLKKTFRPEFLNRLDAIVYFSSLNEQALQQIGEILINQIRNRLSQKNIQLTVDKKAMEALVQSAVKQGVGARALRQSIVEHVENKLATMLLSGQLAAGHRLMITSSQDGFVYIKENN